ncbi:MAG TPA: serine hydrolase [Hyphomonadaceae bacterium]|nr:serine hydrolase [Hyphomonadaceae bacterium]HPI47225.1 serine hydrolase [Hyphomonadaceae bacterium]
MASDWNAQTSDPKVRKLMQGFPPGPDQIVGTDTHGLSANSFPNTRWAFSHQRELKSTVNIRRGSEPVHRFPRKLRKEIDGISFVTQEGQQMTWGQSIDAMFTDGIVVLHRGEIVYETFRGALEPHLPHIAFSVTKSFVGLMAAILAHEGKIDTNALVSRYIPELADTAYGDATVRHVMDMTIGVQYSENYTDPNAEVRSYGIAAGFSPPPAGYSGAETIFDFLRTLKKQGEHGQAFAYKTCNTEVLSWIVQRVTDTPMAQLLSERIWQKLGAEEDAYIIVDRIGTAACGGGMNLSLRDLARFGEMLRLGGVFNGQEIVPEEVVDDIANGGDRDHFAKAGYTTVPGWSYRNQFWVSHDKFGAYTARGIHGQVCWIAPKADVVIARFASHPVAANGNSILDKVSLPAYAALADHLMQD